MPTERVQIRSQRDRYIEETNSLRSELKELWREAGSSTRTSKTHEGREGERDQLGAAGSHLHADADFDRRHVTFLGNINAADHASEADLSRFRFDSISLRSSYAMSGADMVRVGWQHLLSEFYSEDSR